MVNPTIFQAVLLEAAKGHAISEDILPYMFDVLHLPMTVEVANILYMQLTVIAFYYR